MPAARDSDRSNSDKKQKTEMQQNVNRLYSLVAATELQDIILWIIWKGEDLKICQHVFATVLFILLAESEDYYIKATCISFQPLHLCQAMKGG